MEIKPLPKGTKLPNHVAIIPDGNRRWAKGKGLPTLIGHKNGFDMARELVRASREMGIHTMTLWAFSTENWTRAKTEVKYLMGLYHKMIDENLQEAHQAQARIIHLGRRDRLPKSLVNKIDKAQEETAKYTKHILNIALDYGGQDEILRGIARFQESRIRNQELGKETGRQGEQTIFKFADYLDTAGQPYPYPDLMIRTSGEMRTSGLLLWQAAYTEFYFAKMHFPDFTPHELRKAIVEYSRRVRRFGGNG